MKKSLIMALMFILTLSSLAFATNNKIESIESNPDLGFLKMKGTISDIEVDEQVTRVSFKKNDEKEVGWVLILNDESLLIDGKSGEFIKLTDLHKEQEIEVFYRKNTPVLLSYPAQFSPTVIYTVPEELGYFIDVDHFDDGGHGHENRLVITPSEETLILHPMDSASSKLEIKDTLNKDLIVLYKASTKSLPPQTTPETIFVLKDHTEEPSHTIEVDGKEVSFTLEPLLQNGVKLYPVRQIFENSGGVVNWIDETKTIEIQLESEKILIDTIGKTLNFKDKIVEISNLVIIDGRTYASLDLFK